MIPSTGEISLTYERDGKYFVRKFAVDADGKATVVPGEASLGSGFRETESILPLRMAIATTS